MKIISKIILLVFIIMLSMQVVACGAKKVKKQLSYEVVEVASVVERQVDVKSVTNKEEIKKFFEVEENFTADEINIYPDGNVKIINPVIKKKETEKKDTIKEVTETIDNSKEVVDNRFKKEKKEEQKESDRKQVNFFKTILQFSPLFILIAIVLLIYKYRKKILRYLPFKF